MLHRHFEGQRRQRVGKMCGRDSLSFEKIKVGAQFLQQVLDSGQGDSGPFLNWFSGTSLVPSENEVGEGSIKGHNLEVAWANYLDRDEIENGMFSSCGDVIHHPMVVVPYHCEEVKGSEPLIAIHVVVEEQGLP
jgi:hypothetical protein